MKVRNGFVSNSSSSSFVLYGFPASKLPVGIQRAIEGYDYISDIDIDIRGPKETFAGIILHSYSKEYSGTSVIIEDYEVEDSPKELEEKRQFIKKGFKDYYGIDIPDEWFKTFYLEYFS